MEPKYAITGWIVLMLILMITGFLKRRKRERKSGLPGNAFGPFPNVPQEDSNPGDSHTHNHHHSTDHSHHHIPDTTIHHSPSDTTHHSHH